MGGLFEVLGSDDTPALLLLLTGMAAAAVAWAILIVRLRWALLQVVYFPFVSPITGTRFWGWLFFGWPERRGGWVEWLVWAGAVSGIIFAGLVILLVR